MGLQLVNYTRAPGRTPTTRRKRPQLRAVGPNRSQHPRSRVAGPDGLNGFLLLLHVGRRPARDKMHDRLPALLDRLMERGYTFVRVDTLLDGTPVASRPPRAPCQGCCRRSGASHRSLSV